MNEQGLAQQAGGQGPMVDPEMVQQVAQALMQGMTPEELVAKGVPQEVIEAAIAIVQAQAAQQQQVQPGQEGLAGMQLQGSV